ncbi:SGNH/GDSL hydrolase family protein [Kutzneria buriramensis]|uniref:Lysophospholipase L1-like esterase n=1 Tax=Kutzneria buriramensis TaxID=1045776 RepID=A0A3E0HWI0_9PSEU|nr:SGNH/GDSL hydrolase family protein [Kutzneria buriramensis]REH50305.1 lysophospholipase L1-like esterase [Kutzneria buriramensis]
MQHRFTTFVAVGDSFTEGLEDIGPDGLVYRGWADRLAELLAAGRPEFRYANLAVRSRKMLAIRTEQVPVAAAMKADLVTLCAGTNDIIRPGSDPDEVARVFDEAVAELAAAGSHVVIFTGMDTKGTPVLGRLRGKIATYNGHLRASADRHGATVIDLWPLEMLRDSRAWAADRLHPSPEGHRRLALLVADRLGVDADPWDDPWPPAEVLAAMARRRQDLRWAKDFFMPWIGRRLRGVTSGDGLTAKRPELSPVQV